MYIFFNNLKSFVLMIRIYLQQTIRFWCSLRLSGPYSRFMRAPHKHTEILPVTRIYKISDRVAIAYSRFCIYPRRYCILRFRDQMASSHICKIIRIAFLAFAIHQSTRQHVTFGLQWDYQ